jgi:hypothetical protein
MNEDDATAAWAHQQQLEQRRFEEERALFRADAGYLNWLDQLITREKHENE